VIEPRIARRRFVPVGLTKVGVLALLATAVLGLSACDPKQAGSAAVVGGVRVTESSVYHDASAVLAAFAKAGTPAPTNSTLFRALVDRAIDNQVVAEAAKRQGITVTQGQIDKLIDANGGRVTLTADFATRDGLWLPPGQIDDLARSTLIEVALGNKLVPGGDSTAVGNAVVAYKVKLAKELGVAVNPRFGAWNPKALQISGDTNDLSTLATPAAPAG
jgi:peptidyl-prolyl cis-trans isomerase SurA